MRVVIKGLEIISVAAMHSKTLNHNSLLKDVGSTSKVNEEFDFK